jgi:hypothetical protein
VSFEYAPHEDDMADPRGPSKPPGVTGAELDELRRELAAAREQIALLTADKDDSRRPGPVMTNVLAGFIVAGGLAILVVARERLQSNVPLMVWIGVSIGAALVSIATGQFLFEALTRLSGWSRAVAFVYVFLALVVVGWSVDALRRASGVAGMFGPQDTVMALITMGIASVTLMALQKVGWTGLLGCVASGASESSLGPCACENYGREVRSVRLTPTFTGPGASRRVPAEEPPTPPRDRQRKAVKRHTNVVGILPNTQGMVPTTRVQLTKHRGEWQVGRRYVSAASPASLSLIAATLAVLRDSQTRLSKGQSPYQGNGGHRC